MKKFLKIFSIMIISLFIIILVFLFSIPLWFPVDKVKVLIIKELQAKTGREVRIKDLKFNVLKGFEIYGIEIKESKRYKNRPFIKDEKAVLKYNLLALLKKELIIYKFELLSPYVEIIKEKSGKFNFSDILENLKSSKSEKPKKTKQLKVKKSKKIFIKNILITGIGIKNGNFIYVDYSKKKPLSLKIKNFNFSMDNITLAAIKPISIKLQCLAFYNKYKIPVKLDSKAKFDLKTKKIKANIKYFNIGEIVSNGDIEVSNFKNINGKITSVSNTKKMLKVLPQDLAKKIKDLDASIDIENNLNFSFINKKLKFNNLLKLKNGTFSYKNKNIIEKLNGDLKISEKYNLKSNVDFLLAGSKVNLKIKGKDINKPLESRIDIDIYSPKFAIEYLLAMFPKKEKKKEKVYNKKVKKKKRLKIKKNIKAPGVYINLKADKIFYKAVTLGKTIGNIRFVNNKLYSEISVSAYDGHLTNNILINIAKETYNIKTNIYKVNIHQLINDAITILPIKKKKKSSTLLSDIKDKVYGKIDMRSEFYGNTFSNIKYSINGKGNFYVKNGKLTSLDMGRDLYKKTSIDIFAKDIPFDLMYADFYMKKGKINIKNLKIYNGKNGEKGDMRIRGYGYVTVDKDLDFKIMVDFNPKIAKNIDKYFAKNLGIKDISYAYNSDGWLPFDFKVYGNLKKKKYDFSQPRMLNNIKINLQKKIQKEGKKIIKEKTEEILKNLFNK